jgi:hypothetical protein
MLERRFEHDQKFSTKLKRRNKMTHKYFYRNRPPGIGCQPDGFTAQEGGLPKDYWPASDGEMIHAFGWVEYPEPLTFYQSWRTDLIADDPVERANCAIWAYMNRDEKEAAWITQSYQELSTDELEEEAPRDFMARAILTIRKAEKEERK